MIHERLLQRAELAVLPEPFDRPHLLAVGPHREVAAGIHRAAVEDHRAGTALTAVAADLRSGHAEFVAERFGERPAILDVDLARGAVDRQANPRARRASGR